MRRGHLQINVPKGIAGKSVLSTSKGQDYPSFGRYSGNEKYDGLAWNNAYQLQEKQSHQTMTYPGGRKEARREAVLDRKLARKNG